MFNAEFQLHSENSLYKSFIRTGGGKMRVENCELRVVVRVASCKLRVVRVASSVQQNSTKCGVRAGVCSTDKEKYQFVLLHLLT